MSCLIKKTKSYSCQLDANSENQSGAENRPVERRLRGHAPQRRFQRAMPRPPPPPPVQDTVQQAMQRLFVAYNQCVTRVNHTDDRLEQFKTAVRRDATELALTVQRTDQNVRQHRRDIMQMTETFEEVQGRIKGLEDKFRMATEHEHHVNQVIDRNTHSQTASICALVKEQEDIRKLVTELANRLDQSRDMPDAALSEVSTNLLLELGDLKTKVLRLTERNTTLEGDVSFLKGLSEHVDAVEDVVTAIEVREDLDELKEIVFKKFRGIFTKISTLEENVSTLEHDREDSWEAISNKVSTLVEDSVSTLNGRLTELEHSVQSQRTTQEKRLSGLRNFARQGEQYLERMSRGAAAPKDSRQSPLLDGNRPNVSQAYVPGASVSSSATPPLHVQTPTPPTVRAPPIPRDDVSPSRDNAPSPEPHRSSTTHFSTVRSEDRSGAIRMDITQPEQWSAGRCCSHPKPRSKEGA